MAGIGTLKSEVRQLKGQRDKLDQCDEEAESLRKAVEKLKDAITDDIQSNNLQPLLDEVDDLREIKMENSTDSNITDARRKVNQEIKEIERAIELQRKAAEAAAKAAADAAKNLFS